MVLDTALLNTQHYKVMIMSKVEQSRERSSALPYTSVLQLLKREPSDHPRLRSPTSLITDLQKVNTTPNEYPAYDTKIFDDVASVLEL